MNRDRDAWLALLALTAATVGAALLPLGPFAALTALAIAGLKASLVVFRFMRVAAAPRAARLFAAAGLLTLVLLALPVLVDTVLRATP